MLFGGTTPNDASSSAPKLSKAITGRRVDDANGTLRAEGGAGRGGGRSSSSGGRLPPHALLPPPPLVDGEEDEERKQPSGAGRKRAADTDGDDHDRMDDDDDGDSSGRDDSHDHDEGEGGAEKPPTMLGRTLGGVMSSLETVASMSSEGSGGPELLALSVLSLGPDGEVNGEPGTGRVPSLFANHGFQVSCLGGGNGSGGVAVWVIGGGCLFGVGGVFGLGW